MTQPPWWETVTKDPLTQELGISWRDPESFEPAAEQAWTGTMSNARLDSIDYARRRRKLLVGTGPEVARRDRQHPSRVHWYVDADEPELLWCSLDRSYSAWLWVPIEPTPQAVAEVLSHSHPRTPLTRLDMSATARGFLGFRNDLLIPQVETDGMVPFNGADLDTYFTGVKYLDDGSWASNRFDDPYDDDSVAGSQRRARTQRLGRIPSKSWRTLHSRSYLSIEVHSRAVVCAKAQYRPSPRSHRTVVSRLNTEAETDFPIDLPLDVVGALSGFQFARERDLIHNLTSPENNEQLASGIQIFAALWCGDLRESYRLRDYAAHEDADVRLATAQVANWYGYRFLLEEMALSETDPGLRESLEGLIIQGGSPDTYNAFSESATDGPVIADSNGAPIEAFDGSGSDAPIPAGEHA